MQLDRRKFHKFLKEKCQEIRHKYRIPPVQEYPVLRDHSPVRPNIRAYCFDRKFEKIHKCRNLTVGGFGARPAADRCVRGLSGRAGCCRYARPPFLRRDGPWAVVEAEPALGFLISHENLTKTKVRVRNYVGPGRTSRRNYGTLLPTGRAYCFGREIEKIYKSRN